MRANLLLEVHILRHLKHINGHCRCSDNSIDDHPGFDSPVRACNKCYELLNGTEPNYNLDDSPRYVFILFEIPLVKFWRLGMNRSQ